MKHKCCRRAAITVAGVMVAITAGIVPNAVLAQTATWPTKPVTIIVPFAPGGAGNGSVRILSEIIGPQLGQPMLVDNRPGAGGITGTQAVTSSRDDHVLLMGSTTMTILPSLRTDLPYDAQRDLQPIGMISTQPLVLVVSVNSPLKTLDDLIRLGRTGQISAGNSGVGTLSHLITELINHKLGTKILPVPYKGDAVLIPDVVSGTISIGVMNLPVAMPLIQGGKMRALAVTSAQPVASLPGVPVLKSLGNEFVVLGWAALFAGSKVPAAGVARYEQLLRKALAEPSAKERFAAFGVSPEVSTAVELREFVRSETQRWGEVIRASGIKLN
jgi:tripartite-type tricarboxylate transporter receptor subunit TctC